MSSTSPFPKEVGYYGAEISKSFVSIATVSRLKGLKLRYYKTGV
jgi:hypothetical protein